MRWCATAIIVWPRVGGETHFLDNAKADTNKLSDSNAFNNWEKREFARSIELHYHML